MEHYTAIGDLCTRIPALSAWNLWKMALYDADFQAACVTRQGRRVLIDERQFWAWLSTYRMDQDGSDADR
jgi:hypothetical protein